MPYTRIPRHLRHVSGSGRIFFRLVTVEAKRRICAVRVLCVQKWILSSVLEKTILGLAGAGPRLIYSDNRLILLRPECVAIYVPTGSKESTCYYSKFLNAYDKIPDTFPDECPG